MGRFFGERRKVRLELKHFLKILFFSKLLFENSQKKLCTKSFFICNVEQLPFLVLKKYFSSRKVPMFLGVLKYFFDTFSPAQCVTNTIVKPEYKYKFICVDMFWGIQRRIYLG